MLEEANEQKSQTEQLIETIAKFYTPIMVFTALCFATIPWAISEQEGEHYFRFSLVLLVIACPCALVYINTRHIRLWFNRGSS
eukprot:UN04926